MSGLIASVTKFLWPTYDKNQVKIHLRTAIIRLRQQKTKKTERIKQQKNEVLNLVRSGKDELARIKVEYIIRDEELVEAFELLEIFCERILTRLDLIDVTQGCPEELVETLHTLIFAAPRINTEVPELEKANEQWSLKYGAPYVQNLLLKPSDFVNSQVMHKIVTKQPEPFLVQKYLMSIVGPNEYEASLPPTLPSFPMLPSGGGSGSSGPSGGQPTNIYNPPSSSSTQHNPIPPPSYPSFTPEFPTPPNASSFTQPVKQEFPDSGTGTTPYVPPTSSTNDYPQFPEIPTFPTPPSSSTTGSGSASSPNAPDGQAPQSPPASSSSSSSSDVMDLDELTARFEQLKKRNNL